MPRHDAPAQPPADVPSKQVLFFREALKKLRFHNMWMTRFCMRRVLTGLLLAIPYCSTLASIVLNVRKQSQAPFMKLATCIRGH